MILKRLTFPVSDTLLPIKFCYYYVTFRALELIQGSQASESTVSDHEVYAP
jgi:hypothetical protein